MDNIRSFIVTLVTTLILMTAVELIAPDNSIKKYINFVLGLILISVMLAPIILFFSSGETKIINEITKYEDGIAKTVTSDQSDVSRKQNDEQFKKNLNKKCEEALQEKFKGKEFVSDITCEINIKEMSYSIEKVRIGVKDNSIKTVKKIEIDSFSSSEALASKNNDVEINGGEDIRDYLEGILKVKGDDIELYTVDN
ncbi:MAG: stage III sporulation protein AF [Clostridium sp.]